jgi:hypothetical protein
MVEKYWKEIEDTNHVLKLQYNRFKHKELVLLNTDKKEQLGPLGK